MHSGAFGCAVMCALGGTVPSASSVVFRGGAVRGRLRVWRLCAVASITFYIPYT